ncbi:uncharacterized protein cubi_00070 [Cryptosporidium ubiquitum]|uniref:Uncharacterized protein n=1 Tax=Cryptosporidium ubiquitum TaxID=857276 RepID=A0A1J4MNR7_9CRYT|nr:uncharacterized protein cubi_00070 [Cryptosporidium ubiquitum]OII74517.1 hypothetical protein cubi_00070 [Cryptosporidium ubiquitum]
MSNILEKSNGSVESQIAILKERLLGYACKLAPVPKIGKIDTSKNGKCTSRTGSSEKNCDICGAKSSSLFYWENFEYFPETRKINLKDPLDVCTLCLNILDINALTNSIIKSENENSLIFSHFLNVNQIDPTNQTYLQHCISISFAIQILAK